MDKSPSNTSKATTFAKAAGFDNLGVKTLLKYFLVWKILLLAIAYASPGLGYDTSTEILFEQEEQPVASFYGLAIHHLTLRLTRWDGIYFASNSAYGHVNEQNWAFSWALARSTSFISRGV
jgi:GPI mannosyltransferase 2